MDNEVEVKTYSLSNENMRNCPHIDIKIGNGNVMGVGRGANNASPSKKNVKYYCDKWVPVTTAWRVLRLRMEERPPIRRLAVSILNKQSRTADEGGPPA